MKRSLNLALALLVVLALAFAMFAVAETPVAPEPIEEIEMDDTDIEAGGDGETGMGEVSLALGDLVSEGPGAPATVVYRFIVDEAEYRVQQVREGEAVLRPEDPAAPEGMAFAAWVLADGTPLFVDADGDGEADPVIAPVANALVYTGDAQALVSAGEGWLFSVDGEAFTADIPVAVDAGDYTVFFKAADDAEAQALTVTVAKADVVLVPPEAMTGEE